MKLSSPTLEKSFLKLITTAPDNVANYALALTTSEHFHYGPAAEVYERVRYLAKTKGEIANYSEITNDPVISESARKIFADYKKKIEYPSKDKVRRLFSNLDNYRKARVLFHGAEGTLTALKREKVDVDDLIRQHAETTSKAKSITGDAATVIHYGMGNNSSQLVKNLLAGKIRPAIPTGIKAFDDMNVGWFYGSLVLLAGTSGGGKSAAALTIAKNQALYGANVAFVPLEMNGEETNQRLMANIAEVNLSHIIKPEKLTAAEKKRIKTRYAEFVNTLKKKQSRLTVWKPNEDMTIEDILFHLKPMDYNVIFIDYVGLLKGVDGDDQWRELGKAARFAKIFAENNNCIVVLLAQLSDEGQVRYSRAMTEHANNAWYWVRDKKAKELRLLHIIQRKARNQSDHSFDVMEEFQYMRIRDVVAGDNKPVEADVRPKDTKTKKMADAGYFDEETV